MSEIVIGKYTLESLTNGMYSSPLDLFREYVQNAVDSIDNIVATGLIDKKDAKISIDIAKDKKRILISDNGEGIAVDRAKSVLLDIGNSKKSRQTSRGFRGIGRLAGLGYCDRLTFCTSCTSENKKTQISFDAKLLREKLRARNNDNESIFDVINAVTTVNVIDERETKHYFTVELTGVDSSSGLLDTEKVKAYLIQYLPLPYKNEFHWGALINKKIKSVGYSIPEYQIFFNDGTESTQLYKCYENMLIADRVKKCVRNIDDIEIVPVETADGLVAVLWYAKFEYAGTIVDDLVKGIRIRQGNLLIGDRNTANHFFKEERFNGWLVGELFICTDSYIPNARRDDFEDTDEYKELKDKIFIWSSAISKEIRRISLERSTLSAKSKEVLTKSDADESEDDINGLMTEVLGFADEDAEISGNVDESAIVANNELLGRFQILLGQKDNNFKYKILNLRSDLPVEQRKMLEKVFDILFKIYPKRKAETITEDVLKNY